MNGDAGEELIPFGNPLTLIVTGPVNPFCGLSETVTGEVVPPTCVEIKAGEMTILKSVAGGGRAGREVPHALRRHKPQIAIMSNGDFFMAPHQGCVRYARTRFTCFRSHYCGDVFDVPKWRLRPALGD